MIKKFKVGDTIRIRKDSEYYIEDSSANPKDISGIIDSTEEESEGESEESHLYRVNWSNGRYNSYREKDLELEALTRSYK